MTRLLKGLFFLGMVVVFVGAVAFGVLLIVSGGDVAGYVSTTLIRFSLANRQDELTQPIGTDATPRRFTINSGESPRLIAQNLVDSGLITDAELFVDYVRVEGLDTQLEAGTYFLNQTQNLQEIARMLTDSRNSSITFRVFEGQRIEEIAAAIDATPLFGFSGDDFMAVVGPGAQVSADFAQWVGLPVGASLEGFLFPDTYILPPNISPTELRDILLDTFLRRVGDTLRRDVLEQGYSLRDIVTLASITEREAVHEDEHPQIASVYRNRLDIGMRLDADPTVQYALQGERGAWWPTILLADYQGVVSPYNTYRSTGLPPGPIANPGLAAIRAAAYPAETGYYYFRADCAGTNYHVFATTYEEHLANGCR